MFRLDNQNTTFYCAFSVEGADYFGYVSAYYMIWGIGPHSKISGERNIENTTISEIGKPADEQLEHLVR